MSRPAAGALLWKLLPTGTFYVTLIAHVHQIVKTNNSGEPTFVWILPLVLWGVSTSFYGYGLTQERRGWLATEKVLSRVPAGVIAMLSLLQAWSAQLNASMIASVIVFNGGVLLAFCILAKRQQTLVLATFFLRWFMFSFPLAMLAQFLKFVAVGAPDASSFYWVALLVSCFVWTWNAKRNEERQVMTAFGVSTAIAFLIVAIVLFA